MTRHCYFLVFLFGILIIAPPALAADTVGVGNTATSSSDLYGIIMGPYGRNRVEFINSTSGLGYGYKIQGNDRGSNVTTLDFFSRAGSASWTALPILTLSTLNGGSVGFSTTTPQYTLSVVSPNAVAASFNQPIIVGAPTQTNHATTKNYVDSAITGGTSGVWLLSGTNLYASSTSWNVGIGTTTPATSLWVDNGVGTFNNTEGTDSVRALLSSPTSNVGMTLSSNSLTLTRGDTSAFGMTIKTKTTSGAFGATGGYIAFSPSSTEAMRITNRGFVGIGTSTPATKLTIQAIGGDTSCMGGDCVLELRGVNQTSAVRFATRINEANDLAIGDGTTARLFIKSGGNVGIATTTPDQLLHVLGNIRIGSAGGGGRIGFGTLGTTLTDYLEMQDVTASSNALSFVQDSSVKFVIQGSTGNVGIATTTPAYTLDVVGTSRFTQPVIVGTPTAASHAATKNYVDSAITGGTSGVWLLSGSNLYASSTSWNVGIGTSTPADVLHVYGAIRIGAESRINGQDWQLLTGASNSELAINFSGKSNAPLTIYNGGGSAAFKFNPNGNSYLNGGNVGIGTSTPAAKLSVYDSAGSVSDPLATLYSNVADGSGVSLFLGKSAVSGGTAILKAFPNVATPANARVTLGIWGDDFNTTGLTVLKGSNVGIGTVSPQAKLDLSTTNAAEFFRMSLSTDVSFKNSFVNGWNGGDITGDYLAIKVASGSGTQAEIMRLIGNGNVGIGTTGPFLPLHVVYPYAKTDTTQRWASTFTSNDASNPFAVTIGAIGATALANRVGTIQTADYNLTNGGNLSLQPYAGNVGIATTTPQYTLSVVSPNAVAASFNQPIIVGTPTQTNHAATKNYVDSTVGGGGAGAFTTLTSSATTTLATAGSRVGIGTATPATLLDVYSGNINTDGLKVAAGNDANNLALSVGSYSSVKFTIKAGGTVYSTGPVGIGVTGVNALDVNGGMAVGTYAGSSITSNNLVVSGNVGIATTTPQYTLSVVSPNAVAASFNQPIIVGSPTQTNHAATKNYVDSAVLAATSTQYWTLTGSNLYPNSTSYNVGIGTTTPTFPLSVYNNSNSANAGLQVAAGNTASNLALSVGSYNTVKFTITSAGVVYSTGPVGIGVTGVNALDVNGGVAIGSYAGSSITSNNLVVSGNVGIGIASPPVVLDVKVPANSTQMTLNSATGIGLGVTASDSSGYGMYFGVDNTGKSWIQGGRTSGGATAYDISLQAAGGNVGIGTTTPSTALTVVGLGRFTGSGAFSIGSDTSQNRIDTAGPATTQIFRFLSSNNAYTGINVDRMSVGSYAGTDAGASGNVIISGSVGIGTSTPATKLHLYDGSSGPLITLSGATNVYRGLVVKNTAGTEQWFYGPNASNNFVVRRSGTTDDVTIDTAGAATFPGTVNAAALTVTGLTTLSATNPFVFTSIGASTYNKTVVTHDGTNGLYIDLARTSDSSGATVIPFQMYSRGGLPILNISVANQTATTGDVTMLVGSGGTGSKINVGTVDPPYTIGGKKYGTYMAAMTGVKEETTGVLQFKIENLKLKITEAVLDFKNAEEGSDLWLWSKTTNLAKEGLDNVTVLLTPNFDGKVWYEKDAKNMTVTIYAELSANQVENCKLKIENCSLEVSYRLTAPRFDHEGSQFVNVGIPTYGNRRPAGDSSEGFNLDKLLKN